MLPRYASGRETRGLYVNIFASVTFMHESLEEEPS